VSAIEALQIGVPLGGQGWRQIGELALARDLETTDA
jgi:hypothetical protein